MRVVAIIQARMSSTRLPGKILMTVLGKTLLEYQVERLRRAGEIDDLVLATTHNPLDDQLVNLCRTWGLNCFRGQEDDVLDRYYHAAREYEADAVVRVTSDCPLIDPAVVDRVVEIYRENAAGYDYVANTLERTYPRGMDCEVFSMAALSRVFDSAIDGEREHVTQRMYNRPDEFRLRGVRYDSDQSEHRWTVDTLDDFELVRRIIEALYPERPDFPLEDCLDLVQRNPDWSRINRHVPQKAAGNASQTESATAGPALDSVRRLGLGTVQFGLDYGISNTVGQSNMAEVRRILAEAAACGIRLLDTAPSYGEAEESIGRAIADTSSFEIVTKTAPLLSNRVTSEDVRLVMEGFEKTCEKLARSSLYGLLVHQTEDILKDGGESLMEALCSLRDRGRVRKVGVSVYDSVQIDTILDRYDIDLIQVPVNLFDQRLVRNGYLRDLKRRGVEIHARSVFLQGLLLMPVDRWPPYFDEARAHGRAYEETIARLGVSRLQAALGFAKGISEIDTIIVGVNNLEHLTENIEAFQSSPVLDLSSLAMDDEAVLNPQRWPRL